MKRLPDNREIDYTYDAAGYITSITPPGRGAHAFGYSAVNLATLYDPPDIGINNDRTSYTYDLDRALTRITRPDGQAIDFSYDAGGRPSSIVLPNGAVSFTYDAASGNLAAITDPDGGTIAYTYDGGLLLDETWQGEISGTVSRTFDNNFWITQTKMGQTGSALDI